MSGRHVLCEEAPHFDLPAHSRAAHLCLGAWDLPIGPTSVDRSEGSERMFNDYVLMFSGFLTFWDVLGRTQTREVFKKLPGCHMLLLDPSALCGEPWGPCSWQFLSIWAIFCVQRCNFNLENILNHTAAEKKQICSLRPLTSSLQMPALRST